MKTPVVIPAFNEEQRLGLTLDSLPADLVEPIVAVNGSTDATAQVAERFGAQVLEMPQQGKMPAIQHALGFLRERALDPLLILDADARPVFPKRWAGFMLGPLVNIKVPGVVGGPVWYTGHPRSQAVLRSVYRAVRTFQGRANGVDRALQFGPNMAVAIRDRDTLNKVMAIPNYWPSEDKALANTIAEGGLYRSVIHPYAMTWNPTSISAITLPEWLSLNPEERAQLRVKRYAERGPEGSVIHDQDQPKS